MNDIKRAGAIISAYTGIALPGTEYPSNFADMHEYVDGLPGFSGITTGAMGVRTVWHAIRRAAESDFRALLKSVGEPIDSWQFAPDEFPQGDRVLALFERIKAHLSAPTPVTTENKDPT